jgi:hypothetical protein
MAQINNTLTSPTQKTLILSLELKNETLKRERNNIKHSLYCFRQPLKNYNPLCGKIN